MAWWMFYLIASGLLVLVGLLVILPVLFSRNALQRDALTNTQIVRQRLEELEREASEGLISEYDKRQASDELKLALVDEYRESSSQPGKARLPLFLGALFAVAAGVGVYYQVNQLSMVERAQEAMQALPRLSTHLANGGGDSFTQKDITDLSLAIRERLRHAPDDAQGWMMLGRLWMAMGQQQQAIQSLEKALAISPDDLSFRLTYAQLLMGTGEESQLRRAQSIVAELLTQNPQNDNLALIMAVASAQLGDLEQTEQYFAQVKDKLPEDSEMRLGLVARIAELKEQSNGGSDDADIPGETGFTIQVILSDELQSRLPENGFLIVFAQDALSDNRMPAAVVKMPLVGFPITINLSAANAMLPSYSLDSLKEARLVARISSDENVTAQPGDLQGELNSAVKSGELLPTSIVISEELK
ncbi:c-type cytochrome biogenesis protein CcmI [Alteromonas aestuariivivens]|uniref:C-type cytochrome biogenesis protein CcmI n=1 Tax=Alteromonas aestuariivivens TaxID=1938339 RepID=A0A3D8M402_9ALTE|nr:c-type cytochrome biogenesis protein CcmI [Alteromonas aestuariivivens]RDV24366.1 c-type cytochrome biogenesis protein CcmI [Alteromonas aestuariivivens]